MRVYLSLLIYLLYHSAFVYSTIDISAKEFKYLAGHLTKDECRKLVASLYFVCNELPEVLTVAVKKIPLNITCYDLLAIWNVGTEKWQGYGKTHEIVERRLRQIGKIDLSKWLGVTVFEHLAKDLNDTIDVIFDDKANDGFNSKRKLVVNHKHIDDDKWKTFDLILWAGVISINGAILFTCGRMICLACRKLKIRHNADDDELQYLLQDHVSSEDDK